jgi:hypothetical protein
MGMKGRLLMLIGIRLDVGIKILECDQYHGRRKLGSVN